ncbi:MAG: (Fe-S)-binding protein, partial [Fimbriimonadaceae bacterium]|nr:(Fe-S)-binding protein [Fimbriimonadaceae bacterium]
DWEEGVAPALDKCLGCRACETACPSGVHYGAILELGRQRLIERRKDPRIPLLLKGLTDHRLARIQIGLAGLLPGGRMPEPLSRLLCGQPAEADSPTPQSIAAWPDLDESKLPPITREVALLEGCVMRVLFPRVHQATRRLLRRAGSRIIETPKAGCCGALHAHAGMMKEAETRAQALAKALPADLPIIVNSAGCGSTMKEYGEAVGQGLKDLGRRVFDISEFLASVGFEAELARSRGIRARATYHDACHLAHGQKVRSEPRRLLAAVPGLELVDLPESDHCCGSAGIYNVVQPKMARALLDRKWKNVDSTGARIVVNGNPGCHAWIAQAAREAGGDVMVLHTAEILEASFSGLDGLTQAD